MVYDIIEVIMITFGICGVYALAVWLIEKLTDKRNGGGDP